MKTEVRFTSCIPVDVMKDLNRDVVEADKLQTVIKYKTQGKEILSISTKKYMEPDENGQLKTEFIIDMKE